MKKKFVIFMTFGDLWKDFSFGFSILGAWLPDGMSWDIPRVLRSLLNGSSVFKHIFFLIYCYYLGMGKGLDLLFPNNINIISKTLIVLPSIWRLPKKNKSQYPLLCLPMPLVRASLLGTPFVALVIAHHSSKCFAASFSAPPSVNRNPS
jgi:hypothetical protein